MNSTGLKTVILETKGGWRKEYVVKAGDRQIILIRCERINYPLSDEIDTPESNRFSEYIFEPRGQVLGCQYEIWEEI